MANKIRVRIAPSPTGFAHIGTAWMALFNYAFAKKNKGKFFIRLDDTDVKRHVVDAEKYIYEGLSWLGLSWDEGPDIGGPFAPYRQSEKLEVYKKWANELLKKDKAYEDSKAIRFKNPGDDISWVDLVREEISFPGGEVGDFVIIKSDGYPTYNFASCIDDILMQTSHVIRGEEHISNTPRQIALFKAFKKDLPYFAHLPTLRNEQRKKLSKRHDPVDLRIYIKEGYLPSALINFLALLGWSHPDEKEIFDINEFVKLFDLKRVRKSGPIFDKNKLDWMNGLYIRKLSDDEFSDHLQKHNLQWRKADRDLIKKITPLIKERVSKFSEINDLAGFFLSEPKTNKSYFEKDYKIHLKCAHKVLVSIKKWDRKSIDNTLLQEIKDKKFQTAKFFMNLRVAITGSRVTPPINESIVILGKEKTIGRLEKYNK